MSRKGENITQRKDGRWEARVIIGYESGKAVYKSLYASSYKEAKDKKKILIAETYYSNKSIGITYADMLEQFVMHKRNSVKESTLAHYRYLIQSHIIPLLGSINISEITNGKIDEYAKEKLEKGRLDDKGGLSNKTVKDVLSIIRMSLKFAFANNLITTDVTLFASPRAMQAEIPILNREEQLVLEEFCINENNSYILGVYISLYTGIRLGELCALQWKDIDFEEAFICINKTMSRISCYDDPKHKTKIIISTPKTAGSKRQIPLSTPLLKELTKHYKKTESDDCYVLTSKCYHIEPSNYFVKYKNWLSICGIGMYSFHALRHTFATRCIEKGFDPKSLAEILGHSTVHITLNRYVHPSLDIKRMYMEKLMI